MSAINSTDEVQVKQEDSGENEANDTTTNVFTRNAIIFEKNIEAVAAVETVDAEETPVTKTITPRESLRVLKTEPVQSSASKELKDGESSHGQSLKTSNSTTKSGGKSSTSIYKNGFINFLKELENDRKYCQHTALDRIREAAALWKALPNGTKRCYKDQSDTDLIGGLTSSLTSSPKLSNSELGKKVLRNLEMMLESQKAEAASSSSHLQPRLRRTNPYMNFLAEFRKEPENAKKPQAKLVTQAAKIWATMTPKQKNLYKVPTHRAVSSAKSVPRQDRSLEKSTESFMMFVRYFSDFVGNLTPAELIAKATQHWKSLSEWKKKQFTQMAYSKYFKK